MPKNQSTVSNFTLQPSRRLTWLIDGLHLLALSACWLNALALALKLPLTLLIAASWIKQRNACQIGNTHLRYVPDKGWLIAFADAAYLPIRIKPDSVLSKWLLILNFSGHPHTKTLLIFTGSINGNDFRRLRVLLKISGNTQN